MGIFSSLAQNFKEGVIGVKEMASSAASSVGGVFNQLAPTTAKPMVFNVGEGLEKTSVLPPGPTKALASLPKSEPVSFSLKPEEQKISSNLTAKQTVQKQIDYQGQEETRVPSVIQDTKDWVVKPALKTVDDAMRLARASSYLIDAPITYALSGETKINGKAPSWDQIWEQSKTEASRVLPKEHGGGEDTSVAFNTLAHNYLQERQKQGDLGKTNWYEAAKDVGYMAQLKFADIFGDPVFQSLELLKAARLVKDFALYEKSGSQIGRATLTEGKAGFSPVAQGQVLDEAGNVLKTAEPSLIKSKAFEFAPTKLLKVRVTPRSDGTILVEGFKLRKPIAQAVIKSEQLGSTLKDFATKTGEFVEKALAPQPGFAKVPFAKGPSIFDEGGIFARTAKSQEAQVPVEAASKRVSEPVKTEVPAVSETSPIHEALMPGKVFRFHPENDAKFVDEVPVEKALKPEPPNKITRNETTLLKAKLQAQATGAKAGLQKGKEVQDALQRNVLDTLDLRSKSDVQLVEGKALKGNIEMRLKKDDIIQALKDSRTRVDEVRRNLTEFIKESLPPEKQGKFINAVVQDMTRSHMASILERVDVAKEAVAAKELDSALVKSAEKAQGNNIDLSYQREINKILEPLDLKKMSDNTESSLKGLKEYLARNPEVAKVNPGFVEQVARLDKKNIGTMSSLEKQQLVNRLNVLREQGKLKMALQNKYDARVREKEVQAFIDSTQNLDPVKPTDTFDTTAKSSYRHKVEAKQTYADLLHAPRAADWFDGFQDYNGKNAAAIKNLGHLETTAKQAETLVVNDALEEIKALGIEDLTKEQQIKMMVNIRSQEGAEDAVKTLMKTYNLKEIPALTSQEQKVIDVLKKYSNQDADRYGATFEEANNTPFQKMDNYILPLKYEGEFNTAPGELYKEASHRKTQTEQGSTIARQTGVTKTPRVDVLGVFEEGIKEKLWYIHMQPELENLASVVLSKQFKEHAGEVVSNWWKDKLDMVARRGWSADAKASSILRQGRINISTAILGYKVSSILKQPLAIFDAMGYAQGTYGTRASAEIFKEFLSSWLLPGHAKEIISESPALQQRMGGELGMEEVLGTSKTQSLYDKFKRGSMKLLQKADVRTAAGVQQGLENILIRNGVENAKKEAEFLMELVSGSGTVVNRPSVLAHGELQRTLFTFQNFALNQWGIAMQDLLIKGVLKSGFERKLNSVVGLLMLVAGGVVSTMAGQKVNDLIKGKEGQHDSALKTALLWLPEQIPFFGAIIQAAFAGYDSNPPLVKVVSDIAKGTVAATTGSKTSTKERGVLKAVGAGASLLGVPGTAQATDIVGRLIEDTATSRINPFPSTKTKSSHARKNPFKTGSKRKNPFKK